MPKPTFHKLDPYKQENIMNVTIDMILSMPIHAITISHIVENANIARGSFYQYFTGLEDLLQYLFKRFIEAFETHTLDRLDDSSKDIFTFFREGYAKDYQFFTTTKMHPMYLKLLEQRKFVGLDLEVHHEERLNFFNLMLDRLDTTVLDHHTHSNKIMLYILYVQLKNNELHRVISGRISYEDGLKNFLFYINTLEKGAIHRA